MTLFEGSPGNKYKVLNIRLNENTIRRPEVMGLTCGTTVSLLNKKRNGAVIFSVRGTRLAVGMAIAKGIGVEFM